VKAAGIILGSLEHHLDHMAVFCSLMGIPLIVTEEELLLQGQLYYPELQLIFWNCLDAPFETVKSFDTIFYSTPRVMFDEIFFIAEATLQKKMRTIWLPHGNSDKGHLSQSMEPLKNEETALVYGPKMIDFIHQATDSPPRCVEIGNFRRNYYLKHQAFYDAVVQSLNLPAKKTILYAPTWQDGENSSSFFLSTEQLIEQLPENCFLLIKLHPNLEQDIRTIQLQLRYESHPNVKFLKRFTPIYPLLAKVDIYLGDMSSIGYDFLSFNRPMFFFNPMNRELSHPSLYLHQCGRTLQSAENIFEIIEETQSHLSEVRKMVYDYTFGKEKSWDLIKQNILE
jgi:teichoic acid glycerol-phosphate primase